ncbi:MAG: uroporphyrinogen-III synthase [Pseudomonadota bacterium]
MAVDLKGWAVLVTRPEPEARGLASLVTACNGVPIVQPGLTVEAFEDAASRQRLAELGRYDGVILTSANALRFTLALRPRREWPRDLRIFAVGESTRRRAEQTGFGDVIAPAGAAGSEGLLRTILRSGDRPRRLLMLAAPGGRTLLVDALQERGTDVDLCYVYRRRPGTLLPANTTRARGQWNRLLVIATSTFILKTVTAMFENLHERPVVVPSPRVRDEARELGYRQVAVSVRPDDSALLEAAARFVSR